MTNMKRSKVLVVLGVAMQLCSRAIINSTPHVRDLNGPRICGGDPVGPGGPQ
ncbi:MAG: hypothetical protein HXS54_04280 [Theionarchaea archaeon]|nr:hypothetical protein [Theionarchaea archaeon]